MESEKAKNMLEDHGLRKTKVREVVLSSLLKAEGPLSFQEIISNIETSTFNRVTIYRTLETLLKSSLLHRIKGLEGAWRFCVNLDYKKSSCSGNHLHFLCVECGKMFCLLDTTLPWIKAPKGAVIQSKQFLVSGTCSKCKLKNNKEDQ